MASQTNESTIRDSAVFFKNCQNKEMRQKFVEIHKLYDELQGYSAINLSNDNLDQRSSTLKYIVSFAFIVEALDDETLNTFIDAGSNLKELIEQNPANNNLSEEAKNRKRATPFLHMLTLEKRLRQANSGTISDKEKKALNFCLYNYKDSSPQIAQNSRAGMRIGTAILYPVMAIVHGYCPAKYDATDWKDLQTLVQNFRKEKLGIDLTPKHREIPARKSKSSAGPVVDIIFPDEEQQQGVGDDMQLEQYREHAKIVIDEETIEKILQDKHFVTNQDFIEYAKSKFLKDKDYSDLNLSKYVIYITDYMTGGTGSGSDAKKVYPFAGANDDEIKEIFTTLPSEMQNSIIKNNYNKRAVQQIIEDINNFETLDNIGKKTIRKLTFLNNDLTTKMDEKKTDYWDTKEKNKAIRRLYTLTKKENEENVLKSKQSKEKILLNS